MNNGRNSTHIFYSCIICCTVYYYIKISYFSDKIEIISLCTNKVTHRIENKSLCAVISCNPFHCFGSMSMTAQYYICSPVNHFLCKVFSILRNYICILNAPVSRNNYCICKLLCLFYLAFNNVLL